MVGSRNSWGGRGAKLPREDRETAGGGKALPQKHMRKERIAPKLRASEQWKKRSDGSSPSFWVNVVLRGHRGGKMEGLLLVPGRTVRSGSRKLILVRSLENAGRYGRGGAPSSSENSGPQNRSRTRLVRGVGNGGRIATVLAVPDQAKKEGALDRSKEKGRDATRRGPPGEGLLFLRTDQGSRGGELEGTINAGLSQNNN